MISKVFNDTNTDNSNSGRISNSNNTNSNKDDLQMGIAWRKKKRTKKNQTDLT